MARDMDEQLKTARTPQRLARRKFERRRDRAAMDGFLARMEATFAQ